STSACVPVSNAIRLHKDREQSKQPIDQTIHCDHHDSHEQSRELANDGNGGGDCNDAIVLCLHSVINFDSKRIRCKQVRKSGRLWALVTWTQPNTI
ncbi:hypothetical protein RDWZM_010172, partial [Blomia tropicalis]